MFSIVIEMFTHQNVCGCQLNIIDSTLVITGMTEPIKVCETYCTYLSLAVWGVTSQSLFLSLNLTVIVSHKGQKQTFFLGGGREG